MLISKSGNENEIQNEEEIKSDSPVCPNCGAARDCVLESQPSLASYILAFVSLFYFGIWSIFIIPLIFQSTKVIIKRCYYCNVEIEKRKFFQLPNINDKILQFRIGGCVMVISRKYALILLIFFICLFFYFEYNKEPEQIEILNISDKSWIEFLQLCGKYQFIENGLRARHQFQINFENKIVNWKGDFVQKKNNFDPSYPYDYWIYLKMEPTESAVDIPDIVIGAKNNQFPEIDAIKQGQPISFKAQFLQLGSEYNFHILQLQQISIIITDKIQDIKKLDQFTYDMDQLHKIKQMKLNEQMKHIIHMYNQATNSQEQIDEQQKQLLEQQQQQEQLQQQQQEQEQKQAFEQQQLLQEQQQQEYIQSSILKQQQQQEQQQVQQQEQETLEQQQNEKLYKQPQQETIQLKEEEEEQKQQQELTEKQELEQQQQQLKPQDPLTEQSENIQLENQSEEQLTTDSDQINPTNSGRNDGM